MGQVPGEVLPGTAGSSGRLAYIPALDGLRGTFVVLGPLLYHARPESIRGGPDIFPGGILSLDLFFVLSSFLITSIALREWDATGRIDLIAYAGRRARRLFPALLVALTAVTLYLVWLDDPEIVPRWTGAIVSTLTYSANWHEIAAGVSYFEQFDNPSPLKHVWSFAIEEQFYVFAPLFLLVGLRWFGRAGRRVLVAIAVLGALASAVWMALLHVEGSDPSRVYYGTDTRAQALFVGIALALLWRLYGSPQTSRGRNLLVLAGYPALVGYLWMISNVSERDGWMFERFGFLLVALLSAVIIYGMSQRVDWSPAHWFFESGPIRYAGRISYGLYLYHWPIYLLVDGERAGALLGRDRLEGYPLLALHLLLTFAVAAASHKLIEQPFMQRRWPFTIRRVALAPAAFAGAAAVVVILGGLLVANATRPVRIEQVLVAVPLAETDDPADAVGDADDSSGEASEGAGGDTGGGSSGGASEGTSGVSTGSTGDPTSEVSEAGAPVSDPASSDSTSSDPTGEVSAGTSPQDNPADRTDLPAAPLRVMIVGDSVAAQIGWALQDWSQEHPGRIVSFNESHLGCPVARGGFKRVPSGDWGPVGDVCSNWALPVPADEMVKSEVVSWPTALEVFQPEAVISHVSPWDVTDRKIAGVAEEWTAIGDPAFDAYLRSEYQAASELLTSTGAKLYWLKGALLNREAVTDDHAERISGLNRLVVEGIEALPGRDIVMVDFPGFLGEIGAERDHSLRDDGVHLSQQGFDEIAPWLVDIITSS